jgi:phosphopantothenoylcysteine decarboxylase/phosphopantothenate--cysteine ligase
MFEAVDERFENTDIAIFSAAVSDYRPDHVAENKLKKTGDELQLNLVKTVDILATMGQRKEQQFLVGFALETENEMEHAKDKLRKKNLDLIVMNSLKDAGAGFKGDSNKVTLIDKFEKISEFGLKSKRDVAKDIFDEIQRRLNG